LPSQKKDCQSIYRMPATKTNIEHNRNRRRGDSHT